MGAKGIEIKNEAILKDAINSMKLLLTPINSMVVLATLGNTFGKVKDKIIETDKAGKCIVILAVIFIIMLIFEFNYTGSFMSGISELAK